MWPEESCEATASLQTRCFSRCGTAKGGAAFFSDTQTARRRGGADFSGMALRTFLCKPGPALRTFSRKQKCNILIRKLYFLRPLRKKVCKRRGALRTFLCKLVWALSGLEVVSEQVGRGPLLVQVSCASSKRRGASYRGMCLGTRALAKTRSHSSAGAGLDRGSEEPGQS